MKRRPIRRGKYDKKAEGSRTKTRTRPRVAATARNDAAAAASGQYPETFIARTRSNGAERARTAWQPKKRPLTRPARGVTQSLAGVVQLPKRGVANCGNSLQNVTSVESFLETACQ